MSNMIPLHPKGFEDQGSVVSLMCETDAGVPFPVDFDRREFTDFLATLVKDEAGNTLMPDIIYYDPDSKSVSLTESTPAFSPEDN
jgi:hypothetical protein